MAAYGDGSVQPSHRWLVDEDDGRPQPVIDALEMACLHRRPEAGKTIFHSDHGSQDYAEVMEM